MDGRGIAELIGGAVIAGGGIIGGMWIHRLKTGVSNKFLDDLHKAIDEGTAEGKEFVIHQISKLRKGK